VSFFVRSQNWLLCIETLLSYYGLLGEEGRKGRREEGGTEGGEDKIKAKLLA
jgi:hypothetical protein